MGRSRGNFFYYRPKPSGISPHFFLHPANVFLSRKNYFAKKTYGTQRWSVFLRKLRPFPHLSDRRDGSGVTHYDLFALLRFIVNFTAGILTPLRGFPFKMWRIGSSTLSLCHCDRLVFSIQIASIGHVPNRQQRYHPLWTCRWLMQLPCPVLRDTVKSSSAAKRPSPNIITLRPFSTAVP